MTDECRMVSLESSDGIRRVVLDRPPLNILDIPGMETLARVLDEVRDDPDARVLLLTGRGRAFCAGVDVADHTGDRADRMLDAFHGAVERLLALQIPVVAAVNGAALGGGCELVLAADVVLGRAGARIGQPEVRLGVFPPAAAVLLPRLVGRQAALDLLLSGRVLDVEGARALGLVGQVFPAASFEEEVEAYVRGLASLSGAVLRLTKRTVREAAELPLARAMERAHQIYRDELMELDDAREGLAAFLEKRSPVWRNA